MTKQNILRDKSFDFALRIINLYKYLVAEKKELALSKQLLRSGTSVGANIHEAEHAQSKADFISKLNIALKEASETNYWLRLLHKADYLSSMEFDSISVDSSEIVAILIASLKTLKEKE